MNKGKAGEMEIVGYLGEQLGVELRRGVQARFGGAFEPDVVGLTGWWCEAKRVERPTFGVWLKRLTKDIVDARAEAKPLLCWRPNRGIWWAVLRLEDWCSMARQLRDLTTENDELRRKAGLDKRPPPIDAGVRQRTLDEVLAEAE